MKIRAIMFSTTLLVFTSFSALAASTPWREPPDPGTRLRVCRLFDSWRNWADRPFRERNRLPRVAGGRSRAGRDAPLWLSHLAGSHLGSVHGKLLYRHSAHGCGWNRAGQHDWSAIRSLAPAASSQLPAFPHQASRRTRIMHLRRPLRYRGKRIRRHRGFGSRRREYPVFLIERVADVVVG